MIERLVMIKTEIVLPRKLLQDSLRQLARSPRWPVRLTAHWHTAGPHRLQLLLSPLSLVRGESASFQFCQKKPEARTNANDAGYLVLDPERGKLLSRLYMPDGHARLPDNLLVAGSAMQRLSLRQTPVETATPDMARWSRFVGALDMGAMDAFHTLHFAIAGTGRNGSLMAASLARAGVRQLTLIDPDIVEPHNLDSMDGVNETHIDSPKAEALADALKRDHPRLVVEVQNLSVTSPAGLAALRTADIVISCLDDESARLATAMAASLALRPLLDVASGIHQQGKSLRMGGDIRLIVPGEHNCLACFGGFANPQGIAAVVRGENTRRSWQEERLGSLRSLNQINVHLGLRLLEDMLAGRMMHSTWLRFLWRDGNPVIEHLGPERKPASTCPLCALAGHGDDALPRLPEVTKNIINQVASAGHI